MSLSSEQRKKLLLTGLPSVIILGLYLMAFRPGISRSLSESQSKLSKLQSATSGLDKVDSEKQLQEMQAELQAIHQSLAAIESQKTKLVSKHDLGDFDAFSATPARLLGQFVKLAERHELQLLSTQRLANGAEVDLTSKPVTASPPSKKTSSTSLQPTPSIAPTLVNNTDLSAQSNHRVNLSFYGTYPQLRAALNDLQMFGWPITVVAVGMSETQYDSPRRLWRISVELGEAST